jgi:hypothetical protein
MIAPTRARSRILSCPMAGVTTLEGERFRRESEDCWGSLDVARRKTGSSDRAAVLSNTRRCS